VQVELTAQPSLTPVVITELDEPLGDAPQESDTALAVAAIAGGLSLLLVLFFLSRRS